MILKTTERNGIISLNKSKPLSMIQNAKVVVLLGFFNFITYQLTFQKFFIAHFFVSAIKDNAVCSYI